MQHYSISSASRNQSIWPDVGEFEMFLSLNDEPYFMEALTSLSAPYDYGAVTDTGTLSVLTLPTEKSIPMYNFHAGNSIFFFDNTQQNHIHVATVTHSEDNTLTFSPPLTIASVMTDTQYVLRSAPPSATGTVVNGPGSTKNEIELDADMIAHIGPDVVFGPESANNAQRWILHVFANAGVGETYIIKQAVAGNKLVIAGSRVDFVLPPASYEWELWSARQTCKFPQNDSTIELELAQRRQGNTPQGFYQLRLEHLTLPLLSTVAGGSCGSKLANYESLDTIVEINDCPTLNMFFDSSANSPNSASHKTPLCIDPKYLYCTQHHSTVATTNQKIWWKVKIRCNLPDGSKLRLLPHPALANAYTTSPQFHLNQVRWTWSLS